MIIIIDLERMLNQLTPEVHLVVSASAVKLTAWLGPVKSFELQGRAWQLYDGPLDHPELDNAVLHS